MVIRAVTAAAAPPNCLDWLDGSRGGPAVWTCHYSVRPKTTLMHVCTEITRRFFYSFIAPDNMKNLQQSSCKLLHFMSFHCVELLLIGTICTADRAWYWHSVHVLATSCCLNGIIQLRVWLLLYTECITLAGDLHCDNPCSSFTAKSNPEVTALLQTAWMGIFSFGWRTLLRDSIYHPWLPQR